MDKVKTISTTRIMDGSEDESVTPEYKYAVQIPTFSDTYSSSDSSENSGSEDSDFLLREPTVTESQECYDNQNTNEELGASSANKIGITTSNDDVQQDQNLFQPRRVFLKLRIRQSNPAFDPYQALNLARKDDGTVDNALFTSLILGDLVFTPQSGRYAPF